MTTLQLTTQLSLPEVKIPLDIRTAALMTWEIPWSIKDYWFDRYYLLHWQGEYLKTALLTGTESLTHDGIKYLPVWIDYLHNCFRAPEVMLSFRRIAGQTKGFVLIKVKK
jgi:hypothetical protein